MIHLVLGGILDTVCAAAGVLALVRARHCAHGRFAVRAAGVSLVLYALIAVPWRFWLEFGYLRGDPGVADSSLMRLYETVLMPARTIAGSLLLTVAVALLLTALVIRGRREFAQPGAAWFGTGQYHHDPRVQQPRHQTWPPGQGPTAHQPNPGSGPPGGGSPPPPPGQSPPQPPPRR
ncbi:hypothetical protein [Halostreptopolyspora alba]|uniref:Uncharacterized protein n=1 Tax=Halostreptopolyspora alba TaxID=2487137 RepID=A0A3N0EBL3_9ACTN|nr:hypothetical protein EFW17_09160 [Nocardiopsaceae bacterium YIM 96095]